MRRMLVVRVAWLVVGLALIPHATVPADEGSEFSVGRLLFGNLYYVPSHHIEDGDGTAGLVLHWCQMG